MKLHPIRRPTEETTGDDTVDYCVLGGGPVGAAIARRLHSDGHVVTAVGETHDAADHAVVRGDPADVRRLEAADIGDGSTVVAATPRDHRNLLVAQLVRAHFDVSDVVVRVNDPDRHGLVANAGHDPFCATTVLSTALVDELIDGMREPSHRE
jgi:trk system potassium uptake protein TrkA